MRPKHLFLGLCVIGLVAPYALFVPWLLDNGLDFGLFAREAFANRVGSALVLDLLVSVTATFAFLFVEKARGVLRYWWAPILGTVVVGLSFGLPLLLLLREIEIERGPAT